MTHAWSAEREVSADLARSLIETQFPQLAPAQVELLGAGWDNMAFRVNDTYVFRFPRRQFAIPFLESETRVMPAIAGRLPLPVPDPLFVGHPIDTYPWPFAGYRMIPGRTACAAALTAGQRAAAAMPLARFLATLHAVPSADALGWGVGPDTIARLAIARRTSQARESLHELTARGAIADIRPFMAILDTAPADYVPRSDSLVHGDLYVRHLLVDADNRLAGVIDWGDVHLGDPALDLMIAHMFLPPTAHPSFRAAYGPIAELTWQLARLRAVWHTTAVLTYTTATGDADLGREAQPGAELPGPELTMPGRRSGK